MKRVLAIADTHMKEWILPEKLSEMMENTDTIVHAGDFDLYPIYKKFNKYELIAVAGDSDDEKIKDELPETTVFEIEGLKFGVIHKGNYINEFHDLGYKALELGVDVLIFGHLHRFILEKLRRVILICPGSPTSPRLSVASCAEIVIDGSKVDVNYHVVQPLFRGMDVLNQLEGCR